MKHLKSTRDFFHLINTLTAIINNGEYVTNDTFFDGLREDSQKLKILSKTDLYEDFFSGVEVKNLSSQLEKVDILISECLTFSLSRSEYLEKYGDCERVKYAMEVLDFIIWQRDTYLDITLKEIKSDAERILEGYDPTLTDTFFNFKPIQNLYPVEPLGSINKRWSTSKDVFEKKLRELGEKLNLPNNNTKNIFGACCARAYTVAIEEENPLIPIKTKYKDFQKAFCAVYGRPDGYLTGSNSLYTSIYSNFRQTDRATKYLIDSIL